MKTNKFFFIFILLLISLTSISFALPQPIVQEWYNSTVYIYPTSKFDLRLFTVELYCNDVLLEHPNINITSNEPITEGIKFQWEGDINCTGELTFRQNKLEIIQCSNSFFLTDCERGYIDYTDFINSSINEFEQIIEENQTLIKQTITPIYPEGWDGWYNCVAQNPIDPTKWYDCMNTVIFYDTTYYGNFTDLDPSLYYTYSSTSSEVIEDWMDRTELSQYGARLETPILNMDFNSDDETGGYVQDNSIYNNYGTNNGAIWNSSCGVTSAGNDLGGCFEFDGVNDYINAGTAPASLDADAGTISMWVKSGFSGAGSAYYQTPIQIQSNSWLLYLNRYSAGTASFIFDGSSGTGAETNQVVVDDEWHHLVGTNNGTHTLTYVDGVLDDTFVETPVNPAGLIYIGKSTANAYEMNGSIDQVQIWDRALSADEISNLYNGTKNNTNYWGKYANEGEFSSLVFYNGSSTYWNVTQSIADSELDGVNDYNCSSDNVRCDAGINHNNSNLVSYWSLDESFDDLIGGNDGTPSGDIVNATGLSSGAMMFDGADSITVPSQIFSNDNFSISLWMNPTLIDTTPDFIWIYDNSVDDVYCWIYVDSDLTNSMQVGCYDGAGQTVSPLNQINIDQWYNVVVTVNASDKIVLYVDGVYQGEDTLGSMIDHPSVANQHYLGNRVYSGNTFFNGIIDEVLIYNNTLSASEVTELYKAGLSQHANANVTLETRTADNYNISDANLEKFYPLNGTALDLTGNDNGTCSNCPVWSEEAGVVGIGADFDGFNDGITVSSYDFSTNHSISLWFNSNSIEEAIDQGLFGSAGTTRYCEIDSTTEFQCETNTNTDYVSISFLETLQNNKWYHLVLVENDSQSWFLYLNGVLQGIDNTANSNLTINTLGASRLAPGYSKLDGYLDEVRMYSDQLTATEVQNLYELGSYHIEWNSWMDEGKVTDGVPINSTNKGKFVQTKLTYNTDTTNVTPYILNYSVTSQEAIPDTTFPHVIQTTPPNLHNITSEPYNITLNGTTTDETGLSNVSLYINGILNQTNSMGLINGTYNFFIELTPNINATYLWSLEGCDTSNNCNMTSNRTLYTYNEPISGDMSPTINILYPTNITYGTPVTAINFTATDDINISMCWHNATGVNSTPTTQQNYTDLTSSEELNHWAVWCNDTIGQEETDTITFTIDTTAPVITIVNPTGTYNVTNISLSVYANENIDTWVYSLNSDANQTFTPNTTIIGTEGTNSITVCGNDSVGNMDCKSTSFSINTQVGDTLLVLPEETVFNSTEEINITSICKWTNGTMCPSTIYCRLTSYYPNETLLVSGGLMDYKSDGLYSYYINHTNGATNTEGEYSSIVSCYDGYSFDAPFSFVVSNGVNTIGSIQICRYAKFGYYNINIPFMVENNCI